MKKVLPIVIVMLLIIGVGGGVAWSLLAGRYKPTEEVLDYASEMGLAENEYAVTLNHEVLKEAKALFREMMVQASDELGFEAENIPLIIEAVPISNECIMLIVTKVDDPEELDTRFSRFTPSSDDSDEVSDSDEIIYSGTDEILDIFKRLSNDILAKTAEMRSTDNTADSDIQDDSNTPDTEANADSQQIILRIYEFNSLNDVSRLSEQLPENFDCGNTLYKNPVNSHYYLVLSSEGIPRTIFGGICQLASEFGSVQKANANTLYYFDEHYETIIRENALQILRSL